MRKDIVCDSSALISLADSCIYGSIRHVLRKFPISFIITDVIEYECIIHPLNLVTKEYALSALRIKDALQKGDLVKAGITPAVAAKCDEMLKAANNIFFAQGKPITLVQAGEIEVLALAHEMGIKRIMMDERTTRLLIEAPLKIKAHFEREFRTLVMVNKENLAKFSDFVNGVEVFRSTEFLSFAYLHGFLDEYGTLKQNVYSAALYKLKYSGCSISYEEIRELEKVG